MPESSVADYDLFKQKILRRTGLDLESYKQAQMERRLRSFMERAGAQSFIQYYRMLELDEGLMQQFMDRVTINVSELFRNPEQFHILKTKIIPDLVSRSRALKIWSAGCSYGQEAYSIAICLEEVTSSRGHTILATDIDAKALDHAQKGAFTSLDAKNLDGIMKDRWFSKEGDQLVVNKQIRGQIEFRRLDLLKDSFPGNLDLVVCRNVVIYFTEDAKSRLYKRFFDSLKPGGYLFVGGTERVNGYAQIGYSNPLPFFYQKPINR
jgi:chemotaxis protein methyltransferase CheR